MSKKIVISFPGSRGEEVPLLYFGAKVFENRGFEKIYINLGVVDSVIPEVFYETAERVLLSLNLGEYEEIVFLAKSMGTVIACMLKEKHNIPAKLVLLTPVEETLPYMKQGNDILLVAAGDKDRHLDTKVLQEHCEKEKLPYYIEHGIGHRMEVKGNIKRDLEVLGNVLNKLEECLC